MRKSPRSKDTPAFSATLDGLRTITLRFDRPVSSPVAADVTVRDRSGEQVRVVGIAPARRSQGTTRAYSVKLASPPNFLRQALEVSIRGIGVQRVRLGRVLDNQQFYDAEARLGATYSPQGTLFGLFAPEADQVDVVVARSASGKASIRRPMSRNARGVWSATLEQDLRDQYYAFVLEGPALEPDQEVTDPCAKCAQYPSPRAIICDLHDTDPPGFLAKHPVELATPVDAVIYELNVRDFTISPDSGVAHKGLYLGLTENGTHLPGRPDVSTGLDHLVELGITHVQLMPIQCFEDDGQYNWGYMTVFFNTPEARFATTADGTARIAEFKRAVQALHDRGIGVVLDVVLNHTSRRATFDQTAPGYYYRRKPGGELWNGSGCGNEFRTEAPMARKFILDSLKYWVTEYGIDGFRFDLLGLMDFPTLEIIRDELRAVYPSILLYGEPWTAAPSGLRSTTNKEALRGCGVAAFDDHFRDAIKGDTNGDVPGFVQTGDRRDAVQLGLRGSIEDWALHPTDAVHYCECHDNLTLWDKIARTAPNATDAEQKRMQRMAALLLLTSQGIPFIHSGQEFCRTKLGHSNSYNLGDEVNQVDWSLKEENADTFTYYRDLIALRRAHPVFRLRTREEVLQRVHLMIDVPTPRCIAFALDGRGLFGEPFATILILLNADRTDIRFPLGPGRWLMVADGDRVSHQALSEHWNEITVPAHTGVILHK